MTQYLLLFLVVLAVNLLPAFGPPTWSVLVFYTFNTELPIASIVVVGAAAAASGRLLLATTFRLAGSRLSQESRDNLLGAREMIIGSRRKTLVALALFTLSPIPSAQLFEAAGLLRVRLLPFTAAFFAGRLVSYFIYASTAARIRRSTLASTFETALTEPFTVVIQIILIVALVALVRIDWTKLAARMRTRVQVEGSSEQHRA